MSSYTHLTLNDKIFIQEKLGEGFSIRRIARCLDRSPSILFAVFDMRMDVVQYGVWVAVFAVFKAVQGDADNVLRTDTLRQQIGVEDFKQKVGLAAASYTADDLDHAIVHALY